MKSPSLTERLTRCDREIENAIAASHQPHTLNSADNVITQFVKPEETLNR